MLSFELQIDKFLQAVTPTPYNFFFRFVMSGKEIDMARVHYASASTCFRVTPCSPYTLEKSKLFWERDSYSQHEWGLSPQGPSPTLLLTGHR